VITQRKPQNLGEQAARTEELAENTASRRHSLARRKRIVRNSVERKSSAIRNVFLKLDK